jgi:hypothetical protein
MARHRYINTKIWEDAWFSELDQIEQLVFIFLLTNPMTNLSGAYELSKISIGRSTGLEKRLVDEILQRFERDDKVFYIDGYVILKNFIKHQNYRSPTIQKGIEREIADLPEHVKIHISIPYIGGTDTLPHLIKPNLIKDNTAEQALEEPVSKMEKAEETVKPFDLETILLDMEKKPGSFHDIIATFIREKPVKVENSKQLTAVIGRFGRVAKSMAGAYTPAEILGAIDRIKADNEARGRRSQDHIDWTLETVLKYLTK